MAEGETFSLDPLLKAVEELLDRVSFDMNGRMIANKWMGGNGGIISTETIQKCDAVRIELSRVNKILGRE